MASKSGNLLKFTKDAADNARALGEDQTEYRFEGASGLVLLCQPSGVATWWFYYTKTMGKMRKRRKVKLGNREALSIYEAKAEALRLLNAVATGSDPAKEKRDTKEADTLQELCELRFAQDAKASKRTLACYRDVLERYVYKSIGPMPALKITSEQVEEVLDGIRALRQRDMVKTAISSTYKWAGVKYRKVNPARDIPNAAPSNSRTRTLTEAELPVFVRKLADHGAPMTEAMKIIVKLALITGQRREEVCGARVTELALDDAAPTWTLPGSSQTKGKTVKGRTKNKQTHVVPLSRQAVELFRRALELSGGRDGCVFPADLDRVKLGKTPEFLYIAPSSVTKAVRRFRAWAGIEDITPHDLRRTMATFMGSQLVQPHIIKQALNHMPARSDVTARVYNQAVLIGPMSIALQSWADYVDSAAAGTVQPSNVHRLRA